MTLDDSTQNMLTKTITLLDIKFDTQFSLEKKFINDRLGSRREINYYFVRKNIFLFGPPRKSLFLQLLFKIRDEVC